VCGPSHYRGAPLFPSLSGGVRGHLCSPRPVCSLLIGGNLCTVRARYCSACSLPIHCLCTANKVGPVYRLYVVYPQPIHCLCTGYSQPIHCQCTAHSRPIHWLCTGYSRSSSVCSWPTHCHAWPIDCLCPAYGLPTHCLLTADRV
jgi:hypothetical protein